MNNKMSKSGVKILQNLSEQIGAKTQKDFLIIGCVYGAFRIAGRLPVFVAVEETIKLFNEIKLEEIQTNEH